MTFGSLDILFLALSLSVVLLTIYIIPLLKNLASTVKSANGVIDKVDDEIVEILKKVQISQDEINKELGRVDAIVSDVQSVTDKVETTAKVITKALSNPLVKAGSYASGLAGAFSGFMKKK